ncbi:MAG: type II toxin-antitoxin system HicA family toxin [Candidatus Bathyarchaeia archaeon]
MSLRPLPARKVIKLLNKVGFQTIRQRGSHVILKHPDGRVTVIPIHPREDIGRGLLSKIIKDTRMSKEQFLKLLDDV